MKIDHIPERSKAQDLKGQPKVEKTKDSSSVPGPKSGRIRTDTVIISEQARSLQRTEAEMKLRQSGLDSTTDQLREDKIASAKAKLQSGELLSDRVIEKTAENILNSGAVADLVRGRELMARVSQLEAESTEQRAAKLDKVKERIDSGFYNSQDVVEEIAGKIMKDLEI